MDDGGLPLTGSIHCLQGAYINCNDPNYSSYDIYNISPFLSENHVYQPKPQTHYNFLMLQLFTDIT